MGCVRSVVGGRKSPSHNAGNPHQHDVLTDLAWRYYEYWTEGRISQISEGEPR
jgi:hypothetical protein